MMKREKVLIESSEVIAKDTVEMVLYSMYISDVAKPGQFIHIAVEGHTLRRPISIATVDRERETITILFKIDGSGTKQLAEYSVGKELDVIGPLGNGFPVNERDGSTILLIGGGIGVPPLYNLGKLLVKEGFNVKSILGFQTGASVFYEDYFKQLGETYVVTNDGSYGHQGFVTDVMSEVGDFDTYYSCGPIPMLKAIKERLPEKHGFLSLEERMGCGVGACYACVVKTRDEQGYKKICHDGPVFTSQEVIL
ncbi:dihydroorotate dehydrogenase electron transfer subunit [Salirhabdus sp. Marseille-P4669]|uniref:dihydroorotate dehydrogenase electron transfer subunit n=1 Tax=Salirhabdus sp. Marseille-P4669 TaxID=2042310 RepID=UPI000C7CA123|nr:dihydroorotate dehydrogenase electron transfer subunit [Salirhabdus sp. Marseille-P4669]